MLATALWHERYVEESARRILERATAHRPARYILTGDEIPFVQDGPRDGEHIRHGMQQRVREVLRAQDVPCIEVRGSVEERIAACVDALDRVMGGVPVGNGPVLTYGLL